jgi:ABC-type branched-subunit amino acid transport system substrate-binding protein
MRPQHITPVIDLRARSPHRWPALVVLTVAGVMTAACGTTVPQTSIVPGAVDGVTAPGGGVDQAAGGLARPGVTTSGPTGSPSSGPVSTATGGHSPAAIARSGLIPVGSGAVGVTNSAITLGFSLTEQMENVVPGAKGDSFSDEPGQAAAIVDYLNARGGIAGRRIVPVFSTHNSSDTNTATTLQADCAEFTEDHRVFAAYSTATSTYAITQLADCLAKRRSMFVLDTNTAVDSADFKRWAPYVFAPSNLSGDRWQSYVDELISLGYFRGNPKLGLVSIDEPSAQRLVDRIKRMLAARGIAVKDSRTMAAANDLTGLSRASSEASSIVLAYRTQGIDRVMFIATAGMAGYLFPKVAENQGYHPRYAVNTDEYPQVIAANAPPGQFHGAVGVGWSPGWDVDAAHDPGRNALQKLCLSIAHKAGADPVDRPSTGRLLGICEFLFLLRDALDKAREVSAQATRDVISAPGFSFDSPRTFSLSFPAGRYDGVSAVRDLVFDDACLCFIYSGRVKSIP